MTVLAALAGVDSLAQVAALGRLVEGVAEQRVDDLVALDEVVVQWVLGRGPLARQDHVQLHQPRVTGVVLGQVDEKAQ